MWGLTGRWNTTVTRLTPTGSAVVLEMPLLHGEQVTTADVTRRRRQCPNLSGARGDDSHVALRISPGVTHYAHGAEVRRLERGLAHGCRSHVECLLLGDSVRTRGARRGDQDSRSGAHGRGRSRG